MRVHTNTKKKCVNKYTQRKNACINMYTKKKKYICFFFIFSKFFLYKFSSCFLFNVNFVLEISQDSNLHFK